MKPAEPEWYTGGGAIRLAQHCQRLSLPSASLRVFCLEGRVNTKELEKVFERFCACCPAPAGTDWTIHKTKATGRYFYYLATKDGAGVVQPAVAQVFYLSEMAAFLEGMMAYRELYGVVKKKR